MAVGDLSNAVLHRLSDGQCHTIDHLDYALPDFKPRETLRQRAWNAMRMSGAFTIGDIVMAAASGSERDADNNLQRYFCALVKARYLTVLPVRARGTKPTSNGFKRFRLLKDTGPIAPVYRANKGCLFDHNLGERGESIPCQ